MARVNSNLNQGVQGPAGNDGAPGADGENGLGWTGGSYDAGTGKVTFTSNDDLEFSTGDLRGAGSGGSQASRSSASAQTGTINNNATSDITITGFKGYGLYSIQTSHAAWVRLYVDTSSRTADAARLQSVDPAPDAGVVAETITATGTTVNFGPAVMGYTSNASTSLPLAVTNLSGGSASITVTLTLLQLEA